MELLEKIRSGARVEEPVALVLAHPDDETASAGALLQRLANPKLIYLTDGAPRDLDDARREGFGDWSAYAGARKRELRAALHAIGIRAEPLFCDCPDKEAVEHLAELVERLGTALAGTFAVVTHSYEHGHPDHDTAALAVALVCRELGSSVPERIEFAGYHLGDDGPAYGRFYGSNEAGEVRIDVAGEELERKRRALDAHASQRATLSLFPIGPERFRPAPAYDFSAPAPPGRALYDLYGWSITSALWRSRVAELLR